jgi:hypothetical protein
VTRALWLVVAACGFHHGVQPGGGSDGAIDGPIDAARVVDGRVDGAVDAPVDAPPPTPIKLVQTADNQHGNSTFDNVTVAYGKTQTAGNFNIVIVSWYTHSVALNGISDTALNTYTMAGEINDGTITQRIYYAAPINASAANVVTASWPATVRFPELRVLEYSGLSTTNPVDGFAGSAGNSSTTSAGPLTTTHAHDLLIGTNVCAMSSTGAGPGYKEELLYVGDLVEDLEVKNTGSYTATAPANSGEWVMALVAFDGAS